MVDYSRRGFLGALGAVLVSSMVPNITEASRTGIYMPGVGQVYLDESILPNGNFTWNEVTKYGSRIPESPEISFNIIKVARTMEEVRQHFGNKPITVNSWYRDPITNSNTKNASPNSRHLYGDAVDFKVQGIDPYEVHDELAKFWGSKGGLGRYHGFTHLDIRGKYARWNGT